ncbi:14509_t:CDS:2 [Funneliformis mosseae]|uniref:14509_t:CDS:1 n=1 Tax=Funneliformis mosseae TaxID=27381 RepID=A0A9N9BSD7_FUNMO|nr:14509_t:CDS:2 [Funneliformis mosseae]
MDVQRTSTIFNPDNMSRTEDATIVDIRKLPAINLNLQKKWKVKENKPKYINCTNQIWKSTLHRSLTPIALLLKVRLFMLDYNTKSDFRVLFEEENEIIFGEVKPPCVSNNVVNHALIKIAEFMKGSLDSLHKQFGYSSCSETFRGIIKGRILLPTEDANFLNLVTVISTFYSLLEKVDRSIEELNRPFTPINLSYHKESNSSFHKVCIPGLKIPPPAID